MTTLAPARQYYPALDGLRGVAILLVVVYHNFGFINYFFFGWLGVDLFFVLSGFLITDILLSTVNNKNYLKNFYLRRILRICPIYFVVLSVVFFILPFLNLTSNLSYYTTNQLWFWLYLQNWLFVIKLPPNNIFIHFWSLAVEEQFYLIWPFAVLWIKNPKKLIILVLFVLILVIGCRYYIWARQIERLSYFSLYTYTRIDGICIGCLVALIQSVNKKFLGKNTSIIVTTLAALNFLFFFFNKNHEFTFPYLAIIGYTTFASIFGICVYEISTSNIRLLDILLNTRILKFFGKISYSLYIFHWPIYVLLKPFINKLANSFSSLDHQAFEISASILITAIAVLLSYFSFTYFENYFLKIKSKFAGTN